MLPLPAQDVARPDGLAFCVRAGSGTPLLSLFGQDDNYADVFFIPEHPIGEYQISEQAMEGYRRYGAGVFGWI